MHADRAGPSRLYLLVLRGARFEAHPLPSGGDVELGRGADCDVTIDDPSISRTHAVIHLGPPLALEDAGSVNGTVVRDEALEPHRPVPISFNEVIAVGAVMIIVQQRTSPIRQQRIWSHDYFEGRLADECARADRSTSTFTVLRIRCLAPTPEHIVHDIFAEALRSVDVAGSYGPSEYEILLPDLEKADAERAVARMSGMFAEQRADVRIGTAHYPEDGRDPDNLVSRAGARARDESPRRGPSLVLKDPAMKHLYELAGRIAAGGISVLLVGETGSGKELLAETIHHRSPRSKKPFLRLNCAALSATLLESELFGHEKGAFTGALAAKPGLLETAEGGTVFLDEIGELAMSAQVKLLRVMEEQMVLRVGGLKPRPIDVRFVAATNRDLEDEIERGAFREDLYYRIAGVTLAIPPLRHRMSEIDALAEAFISRACEDLGGRVPPRLSDEARVMLRRYSWPGNIRELRNVMERVVLLCTGNQITTEHLPVEKMTSSFTTRVKRNTRPPTDAPTDEDGSEIEHHRIMSVLEETGGNQTEAAKLLGISRRTLGKRMKSFGIPRPRKGRD